MILDSSVVVAVVLREPGWQEWVTRLQTSPVTAIGSATLVECGIVLRARLGLDPEPVLERFLSTFTVEELPFGPEHRREALDAFRRFGKGRHPAALNFGDCLSYATARLAGMPLGYVGEDFSQTDLG